MRGLKIAIPFLLILNLPGLTLAEEKGQPAVALILPETENPEFLACLQTAADDDLLMVSQVVACAEDSGLALGLLDTDATLLNLETKWDGSAGPNDPRFPVPSQAYSSRKWDGTGGPDDPRSPIPAQARASVKWDGSGGPDDPRSPVPDFQYLIPPKQSTEGPMPPILMSENGPLKMQSAVIVMEPVDQAVEAKSPVRLGTVLGAGIAMVGFFFDVAFKRFGLVLQALT